jgi:hypothetical protein
MTDVVQAITLSGWPIQEIANVPDGCPTPAPDGVYLEEQCFMLHLIYIGAFYRTLTTILDPLPIEEPEPVFDENGLPIEQPVPPIVYPIETSQVVVRLYIHRDTKVYYWKPV